MSESLVFVIDPTALPTGLLEALGREGCKVETVPAQQVSGALLISAPGAIVAPREHADEVARAIRSSASRLDLPFLVVAPVDEVARYRAQMAREITALVPDNTDPSALAVRVKATMKQASARKARPRTLVGAAGLGIDVGALQKAAEAATRPAEATDPTPPPSTTSTSVTAKGALPRPSVARPAPPAPTSPSTSAAARSTGSPGGSDFKRPSLGMRSTPVGGKPVVPPPAMPTPAISAPPVPAPAAHLPSAEPPSSLPLPAEPEPVTEPLASLAPLAPLAGEPFPLDVDALVEDTESSDAQLLSDADHDEGEATNVTAFRPAAPTPAEPPPSQKPVLHQWIDVKSSSSRPPPPAASEPRVEVGLPATEVLKLRIALADDDVTRSDAVARALRLEGQEVFPATAGATSPRWALLRQFAPQVIVLDAEVNHDGGLREALSEDPFLRETPVVFQAYSRIFNAETGKAHILELDQKLAGIGKAELDFTLGLEAGKEMKVARGKINPGRLLALLKEFGRSVVIRVEHGEEVMTWILAGGLAGVAELTTAGRATSLAPDQALDHVLRRPHARITAQMRRDVSAREGADVYELLERAYREYLPTTQVRPSSSSNSSPVASAAPLTPLMDATSDSFPLPRPERPLIPTSAFLEIPDDSKVIGKARRLPVGVVVLALIVVFALGAGAALAFYKYGRAEPDIAGEGASAAALGDAKVDEKAPPDKTGTPGEKADAEKGAGLTPTAPPQNDKSANDSKPVDRFTISQPIELPTCEELLGKTEDAFAGKPKWQSANLWKEARKLLMAGRADDAQKAMCKAAFIDPKGPATSGLASYYLSKRALKQAEAWARRGAEGAKTDGRRAKELLGDTLNQLGRQDEAKAVWLETLKLTETDTDKLRVVAKTLASSAQTAIKGGDLPLAERLLRRAATFDPENAEVAGSLARVLFENEEPALAEMWANVAQSLDPESPEAFFVLGEVAMKAERKDEAREYFQKVPKNSKLFALAKERMRSL